MNGYDHRFWDEETEAGRFELLTSETIVRVAVIALYGRGIRSLEGSEVGQRWRSTSTAALGVAYSQDQT